MLEQEIPQPPNLQLHECRWGWCRLTFPTAATLKHHVIHEHVRQAKPVKRGDLAMLRRIDDGIGESLALDGLSTLDSNAGAITVSQQDAPSVSENISSQGPNLPVSTPNFNDSINYMPPTSSYPSFQNAISSTAPVLSLPSSSAPGIVAIPSPSPNAGSERTYPLESTNRMEDCDPWAWALSQAQANLTQESSIADRDPDAVVVGANGENTSQISDDDDSYMPGGDSNSEDTSNSTEDDDADYMYVDASDESESSSEYLYRSDSGSGSTSKRNSPERGEDHNLHGLSGGGSEESAEGPNNGPSHPAKEDAPNSSSLSSSQSLRQDFEKRMASSPSPGNRPNDFDSRASPERRPEEKAEVHENVSTNGSTHPTGEATSHPRSPEQNFEQNMQDEPSSPPARGSRQELLKLHPQLEPEMPSPKPSDSQSSLESGQRELPDVPLHFLLQTQAPYETSIDES